MNSELNQNLIDQYKIHGIPLKLDQSIEERIIFELDSFATNYDNYEHGLPTHEPQLSKMKEIISIILKQVNISIK